jgi:hypothetical protein
MCDRQRLLKQTKSSRVIDLLLDPIAKPFCS